MKVVDIRKLGEVELHEKLKDFKQELFNLRWQTASQQTTNPKRIREVKRSIARILTIVNEREQKGNA